MRQVTIWELAGAMCLVMAAGLAAYGRDGWGWFLFVGFLLVSL